MNPSLAPAAFEGVSGAVIVSVTSFFIVFAVLLGLTTVIYAIKIFSGEDSRSNAKAYAAPAPSFQTVSGLSASAAPVPQSAGDDKKVVAVITAAILAATGGRGRVLSVLPERTRVRDSRCTRTWRTAGLIEQVGSCLRRPWKH